MAQIQISRGDAYVAGDMMIQMFIDGKKVGSLIGAKPLDLALSPGLYTIQARIAGIQRGEAIVVPVYDDTKELAIAVSGTRIGLVNNLSVTLVWLTIMFAPVSSSWTHVLTGLGLGMVCLEMYRWWKMKPQRLRLNVFDEIPVRSGSLERHESARR